jgi:hypothetical protein
MHENFLTTFPSAAELIKTHGNKTAVNNFAVNGHIHTPYSFSAFEDTEQIFSRASDEKIGVLGINDFFVSDGYESFQEGCIKNGIFPLFNIEFIGLMKEEKEKGIRINDPNNPGRIYFCGKGLDYPFHPGEENRILLEKVKEESQEQIRAMVEKVNIILAENSGTLSLGFAEIKRRFARELVRERHIAKAIRVMADEELSKDIYRLEFYSSLFGERQQNMDFTKKAALENEIRSRLLKAGGRAFVEEDEKSFLPVSKLVELVTDAGGIPCYPVLLDDAKGKYTEFESDKQALCSSLTKLGVGCIELIPGRNSLAVLQDFVKFFDSQDFIITFGTEHNTPEMIPLRVSARGGAELGDELLEINRRGAAVIAAHQYLRAKGKQGYLGPDRKPLFDEKKDFEILGKAVIDYHLNKKAK